MVALWNSLECVYRIIFRLVDYFPLFWSTKICCLNHHLIKMSWGNFLYVVVFMTFLKTNGSIFSFGKIII